MSGLDPRIIFWPAKILSTPCVEVENFDESLQALVDTMKDVMKVTKGIGITANQIGDNRKVVMIEPEEDKIPSVFVNPTVEEVTGEPVITIEGCLSVPGVIARLNVRYPSVVVSAYSVEGMPFQVTLVKRDAVALQHEMDHTKGLTMFDHMKRVQKMMSQNKCKKRMLRMKRSGLI